METKTNQQLEQKVEPIDSFYFKGHQLSVKQFDELLKSNNLTSTETDSYYFTTKENTRRDPGQRHVEVYYFNESEKNLMKGKDLLLKFHYSREEEWQYDGYDQLASDGGRLSLFKEDDLARKIYDEAKKIKERYDKK